MLQKVSKVLLAVGAGGEVGVGEVLLAALGVAEVALAEVVANGRAAARTALMPIARKRRGVMSALAFLSDLVALAFCVGWGWTCVAPEIPKLGCPVSVGFFLKIMLSCFHSRPAVRTA